MTTGQAQIPTTLRQPATLWPIITRHRQHTLMVLAERTCWRTAAANDVENKRKLFLAEDFSSFSPRIPVMTEDWWTGERDTARDSVHWFFYLTHIDHTEEPHRVALLKIPHDRWDGRDAQIWRSPTWCISVNSVIVSEWKIMDFETSI